MCTCIYINTVIFFSETWLDPSALQILVHSHVSLFHSRIPSALLDIESALGCMRVHLEHESALGSLEWTWILGCMRILWKCVSRILRSVLPTELTGQLRWLGHT